MNAPKVSKPQLFFLIIKTQIGIGLLSLPSDIHHLAKRDSWISVLAAGMVIQIVLFAYWLLLRQFPNQSMGQITERILGPYAGKAVNVAYYVFFILIASYASTLYVQLIQLWMLPLTPGWVLFLLIVGTSVYLAVDRLDVIARFFVLASILFAVLLLISVMNFMNPVHLSNLLPVGRSGTMPVLQGSERTFFAMLGFEVTLYFYAQVEGNRAGMLRVMSLANAFVTLFYTYFVFLCLIGFSPVALEQINEPVLFILKGLAYRLIDRIDLIFLTIWIIPMTATIVSYLSLAGRSLTARRPAYRKLVALSGVLVFATGWCLSTIEQMKSFSQWLEYGYFLMITAVPAILWLASLLVRNKEKAGAA